MFSHTWWDGRVGIQNNSKISNTFCIIIESSSQKTLSLLFSRPTWSPLRQAKTLHTVTSGRPCWCPLTKEGQPCGCPKLILRELNCILMHTFSFGLVEKHAHWSREWKLYKSMGEVAYMGHRSTVWSWEWICCITVIFRLNPFAILNNRPSISGICYSKFRYYFQNK